MSIRKTIITTIVALAVVAVVAPGVAIGTTIDDLLAQIALLQAQLVALQSGGSTGAGTGACAGVTFTRNLTVGSTGSDVKCLQQILNSGATTKVSTTGAGSPGNETTYFGSRTLAAVKIYQAEHGWTPANQVGPLTRQALNASLGTTGGTIPPIIVPTGGGITIGLAASTPAAANVPKGAFNQPITNINLTAGTTDVKISKITITRSGLSANTDIDLVKLFVGTIQKGNGASLNSNNQAVFTLTTPITVAANTTTVLTVKADIKSTATSGATLGFNVAAATDVVSDASTTTGTAVGNLMSVVGTTIGSITIAAGPNSPSSNLAPEVGNTGVRILQMNLQTGSTENVEVRQVIAVKVGTVNTTDISKVELYNDTDGASLGSVTTFDAEGRATFDLASPLLILKGESKNLSVKVDIASGSGKTISAKAKDSGAYTVTAVGKTYGFGVGFASSTWDGTATSQTIAAGSLVVTKSASTPATGFVAPGGSNVPITTFNLEAKGEGVTITEFSNTVILGTATYANITACKLVDESGNVAAGPVDTTAVGTADTTHDDYIRFTDTFTVPLGVHKYTVQCKLASSITSGTIQIGFDDSNIEENASGNDPYVAITAKGAVSNDTITATPQDSDVLGNALTFQAAALTVTNLTTPVLASIVPGQQNIHFANVSLGAASAGENINITSIVVTDDVSGAGDPQGADIQNLRLFDSSITQANCTGTGRAWDSTLTMCRLAPIMQPDSTTVDTDDTTTFTLSTPLVVPKAGSSLVKVYGDFKSSGPAANEVHTFYVAAVTDITAIGATTGTTLTTAMKGSTTSGTGQAMTYASVGTLTTTLDSGKPNSANIAVGDYGITAVPMTKIKLYAPTEAVDVDYVNLTRTSGGTGVPADIANVYVYGSYTGSDANTLLATGTYTGSSVWKFDLTNFTVPVKGTRYLTVRADLNGVLNGATTAYRDAFDLAATGDLVATGQASGTTINASAVVNTQPDMYLYRSVPILSVVTPSSTTLVASNDQEIIRINVKADSAGDIEFVTGQSNYIRFTMGGAAVDNDTTSTTENFVLKNVTDNETLDTVTTDVSQLVAGTASFGSDGVAYMVKFDFTDNALTIPAGLTKVIKMEADLNDFEAGTVSNYISATIANSASDFTWSDLDTDAVANNTFFTWLPLQGLTLSN